MYANVRWTLGKSHSCLCRHSLGIALIEPSHNEAIYSEINLPFSGDSEWEIAPSNLKVEKVIGHGAFGVVSRGLAFNLPGRPGWTVVAVKSVQGNKWLNLSTSSFNSFVCSNPDFESRTWHNAIRVVYYHQLPSKEIRNKNLGIFVVCISYLLSAINNSMSIFFLYTNAFYNVASFFPFSFTSAV